MYIVTCHSYPSDKAMEVAKTYLEELKQYPWDKTLGTEVIQGAVKTTECGIKVIRIVEAKKGKVEQAIERIVNQNTLYLGIVGFEYSSDIYYSIAEAFASVGMSLPK